MKLAWVLFALLLAMCLLLAYLFFATEPPAGAAGVDHPEFDTMQRGGEGARRTLPVLVPGYLLGILEIALFVGLLALGARRQQRVGGMARHFLIGLLLFTATFTALVITYRTYAIAEVRPLVLSFPAPSAWMLYGLWPIPLYFLILYVLRFDRWVISDEEVEQFKALVARRRERGEVG